MHIPSTSLVSLLRNCTSIIQILQVHAQFIVRGLSPHNNFLHKLTDFQCVDYARAIFNRLPEINDFSWNTMIRNYALNGHHEDAVLLYREMLEHAVRPSNFTFPMVLKACSHLLALGEGRQIHAHVVKLGFDSDLYNGNCLIGFYGSIGSIGCGHQVFDEMPERDLVSWNSIISGYVTVGEIEIAHELFSEIPIRRNVISWTALIGGYGQLGRLDEMVDLFVQMLISDDSVNPNAATMVSLISACSSFCNFQLCRWICTFMEVNKVPLDVISSSALLSLYAECGMIDKAQKTFESMPERNLVSWNAMINGYVQCMMPNDAIQLFDRMREAGTKPNEITMVGLLTACAVLGALDFGKWLHCYISRSGLNLNVILGTALVDMYSKCGSVDSACHVFVKLALKDVVTWNAMICGFAMHGNGRDALIVFAQMQRAGSLPNDITFVGVLCACNHCGLVEEGLAHFASMFKEYDLLPRVEHYACMIDLFGRAGHIEEMIALVQSMPFEPDAVIWGSLLSAFRIHKHAELANRVGQLLLVSPSPGNSVLLANIYAAAGWWKNVSLIRRLMKERRLKKPAGFSCVEVDCIIHGFVAEDVVHLESVRIYETLRGLMEHMKNKVYIPYFDLALQNPEGC